MGNNDPGVETVVEMPRPQPKRGERIPAQDPDNGYFQCWYPIAMSSELARGKVIGREFMNGRVIAFRGEDGEAVVTSAYCRHMGADLTVGEVVGNQIRCAYHHWSYDRSGACTRIAIGDVPPRNAQLFRFPSVEKWGLIWAFNGTEPLYDVPGFPVQESELVLRTEIKDLLPVEPYVPFSNAMDFQHLQVLHGLKIESLPEDLVVRTYDLEYTMFFVAPMLGRQNQYIRMFGSNSIVLINEFMGRKIFQMSAGRVLPGGRTQIYNTYGTFKASGKPGEEQMIEQVLNAASAFGDKLQAEDKMIQEGIRFRRDCLSSSDRALATYLRFVQDMPRSNVACDLIS